MSSFNRFDLQVRAGLLDNVDLDSWERIIWFPQLEQGVSMERTPFDQTIPKGEGVPTLEPSGAAIRVEINQPSSSTYTPPTTQPRQSVPVPSQSTQRSPTGQPPVAEPSHIPTEHQADVEPELSPIAIQPRIEISDFVTRNHLWDVFRGKLISQQSAEPHAKTEKRVLVQLTYLHHFPSERLGPRPPYSNREERFTESQALEGIKRESKFYQKYGDSLKDVIPSYIGTYQTSFQEREGGYITVELYGMVFEDPGELVGDAWMDLAESDVDDEIWSKVHSAYDTFHSLGLFHDTDIVALNLYYDKIKDQARIANHFDTLVISDYDDDETNRKVIMKFWNVEKYKLRTYKRTVANRSSRSPSG